MVGGQARGEGLAGWLAGWSGCTDRDPFPAWAWNSFVPVAGLHFALDLIPACLTPSNTERGR